MHDIPLDEPSPAFSDMWRAAAGHLHERGDRALSWMKADLVPPILEHLSFRMGNQLFFIRVEDRAGMVEGPGSLVGLLSIADACRGYPCLMFMAQGATGWEPVKYDWGLVDARTGALIEPPRLVTGEPIEMTDWELHDFAVQIVRDHLRQNGRELMSSQGNPSVDPSLWFVGDNGPEWVVVRAARYPAMMAERPGNLGTIAASSRRLANRGHFASVVVASADDAFDPETMPVTPLWRGGPMIVRFEGLQPAP